MADGEQGGGGGGTFADLGLCRELAEACESLGWKAPSRIQAEAIPYALQGRDVIGLAQTGSGKTAAFALPILQALLADRRPSPFFALVLSPARELAIQISDQFQALGSSLGLRCSALVGGVDIRQQAIAMARHPHVVVATPGRLFDHLSNTKGFSLRTLKYLVLDEADKLLNKDFEQTIEAIMNIIPKERRTYLYSATITKKVKKLQRACLTNPVKIEAASKYSTVCTLEQQLCVTPAKHKDIYLVYILTKKSDRTTMVFVRTCESTLILSRILCILGFRAIPINGQMSQSKRLGALNKFKAGVCNILVCTNVASRGLDIPTVDTVINHDIPTDPKDYIHRVGRTARAGRSGLAISLASQIDVLSGFYGNIEKHIGKRLPLYGTDEKEVKLFAERVSDAKRMSNMEIQRRDSNRRRKRRREQNDDES